MPLRTADANTDDHVPALTVFSNAAAEVGSILTFIKTYFWLPAAVSISRLVELLL